MKTCSHCKQTKPISEFAKDKHRPDGFTCQCKFCIRKSKRKYRQTPKGIQTEKKYQQSEKGKLGCKGRTLKFKYGITLNKHKQMYAEQNGQCLICSKLVNYMDIVTDHDHLTGKVRGLICRSCNTCLGWFENHKQVLLKYLGG